MNNAQRKIDALKAEITSIEKDMGEPGVTDVLGAKLERKKGELDLAEAALTAAKEALEKCKKDLEMAGLLPS